MTAKGRRVLILDQFDLISMQFVRMARNSLGIEDLIVAWRICWRSEL
jgi:hypothetical protein